MKEWKGSCLSDVTRLRYSSFPSPFPSLHLSFLSLRPGEVSVENGETSSDGTRRCKTERYRRQRKVERLPDARILREFNRLYYH